MRPRPLPRSGSAHTMTGPRRKSGPSQPLASAPPVHPRQCEDGLRRGRAGLGLGLYSNKQAKACRHRRHPAARRLPESRLPGRLHPLRPVRARLPLRHPATGHAGQPVATGTPYFVARSKPCEMCEDIPCVKACPTGALDHDLTDINQAKMGLAVLVDHETCLNFLGLRCDVCYRVCPVIDKAITLETQHNPRTGRTPCSAHGALRALHRLRQVREILRAARGGDQGLSPRSWPRARCPPLPQGLGRKEQGRSCWPSTCWWVVVFTAPGCAR
jgi:ferredoxin